MTDVTAAEIRAALGVADDVDPVAAIATMRDENATLQATIAAGPGLPDAAEVAQMRRDLADAQRRYLTLESKRSAEIRAIQTK